jgi:hypothetical protein
MYRIDHGPNWVPVGYAPPTPSKKNNVKNDYLILSPENIYIVNRLNPP